MTNKKAPKSMLDLHLDVEGDTHAKVSLTRTPESTSFRLATAESGHQSLMPVPASASDDRGPQEDAQVTESEILALTSKSASWFRRNKREFGLKPSGKVRGKTKPLSTYNLSAVAAMVSAAGFDAPTLDELAAYRSGGGEVAPRAPASSSTLRLELIVETP